MTAEYDMLRTACWRTAGEREVTDMHWQFLVGGSVVAQIREDSSWNVCTRYQGKGLCQCIQRLLGRTRRRNHKFLKRGRRQILDSRHGRGGTASNEVGDCSC